MLPLPELVSRIRSHFPERRACPADSEAFWSDEQRNYHGKILWLKELAQADDSEVHEQQETADEFSEDLDRDEGASASPLRLAGLKRVRADEDAIASFIRKAGPLKPSNISEPNWQVLLRDQQRGGFPKPASERGRRALEEKERALHALWSEKLSVLSGGAGTGKTSVVRVFLEGMRDAEGARTLLLTAPTGKARVRLETKTQRRAKTIHQVLYDAGLLEEGYRVRRDPTKAKSRYESVIVDEASMPSVELLAALLRAIEVEGIRRFILVGDPYQLPPIGPGRPFFDAIRWLRQNRPKAIAELATSMRVSTADDGSEVPSFGLSLAAAFRAEKTPGDDEVFSELASRGKVGDTTLHLWKDTDDLETAILNALASDLPKPIKTEKDFDLALGIPPYEKKKGTDGKIDARKAESWQLLSPNRILGHGSDRLNRLIQGHFRPALLSQARDWRSRWPRPFGDTEIVFHDKVLQAVNTPKWLPKDAKGLRFVANGEIGIVEEAWKGSDRGPDNIKVRFSTQPDCLYGYKRREVDEEGQLELAYALTVHKAQGSDFESVILIITKAAGNLSRELIYTGLTRFTDKLILLVQEDINSLLRHRDVIASDTLARTTMMFEFAPGVKSSPTEDVYAPYRPEGLIHRTSTGVAVRSKSEIVVADVLTHLGLSWTYEEPLKGKSGSSNDFRIPDFTIRRGGETWYWEHLGMLDRADYQARWKKKKAWYEANGYAQQLITSEESATEGLRADILGNIAQTRILKDN